MLIKSNIRLIKGIVKISQTYREDWRVAEGIVSKCKSDCSCVVFTWPIVRLVLFITLGRAMGIRVESIYMYDIYIYIYILT